VLEVNNKHAKSQAYFGPIFDQMKKGAVSKRCSTTY
jgi:hypothetical protein